MQQFTEKMNKRSDKPVREDKKRVKPVYNREAIREAKRQA